MGHPFTRMRQAEAGFTLLEVVVAVALMGLVVGTLATVTGQWLPTWKHSLLRTQRNEKVAIALDRLVMDLSAALYVSPERLSRSPLFRGDERSVLFVRSAIGPNGARGLEFVQIAEITDSLGPALVRMRAPFTLLPSGGERIPFSDPVVLLRAPLHVAFAYAAPDGKWAKVWRNSGQLPSGVRFVVRDEAGGPAASVSTATRLHVDMMAPQPEPLNEPGPDQAKPSQNAAAAVR
jgi:general secretion pathway protein J